MNLRITPGTCDMTAFAAQSFGPINVAPAIWNEPVTIFDLMEEDIDAFIDLVREMECEHGFNSPVFSFEKF